MDPTASLDGFVSGLSPGLQFLLNVALLVVAVAAAAFGYFRRPGRDATPSGADPGVQIIGATLADRGSVMQLTAALDRLTATLDAIRHDAAQRDHKDDRQELIEEILRLVPQRPPPRPRRPRKAID